MLDLLIDLFGPPPLSRRRTREGKHRRIKGGATFDVFLILLYDLAYA
jgi:hypothetical protein